MSETVPVFVDGHCVRIEAGQPMSAAVALHDPRLAARVLAGTAYLADGRGIRLAADAPAHSGAILRVVVSARRNEDEGDAYP